MAFVRSSFDSLDSLGVRVRIMDTRHAPLDTESFERPDSHGRTLKLLSSCSMLRRSILDVNGRAVEGDWE